jgi:hypothetical protein
MFILIRRIGEIVTVSFVRAWVIVLIPEAQDIAHEVWLMTLSPGISPRDQ